MATNTSILGLTKPTYAEDQDVSVLNANSDLIDAEAGRLRANFAGTYSATDTYAVGDYCIYQGNLYRCTTAISSGEAWNSAHWSQVSAGDELTSAKQAIANIGTIVVGTNTGYVTTTSGTKTEVGSITLPAGSWIISGSIDWAANGNGYRQATFDTAVNDNPARGYTSCIMAVTTASKQTYQQIVRILKLTDQTEVKFYGQQNSGDSLAAYPYVYAMRII